jgi:hypothetical protein
MGHRVVNPRGRTSRLALLSRRPSGRHRCLNGLTLPGTRGVNETGLLPWVVPARSACSGPAPVVTASEDDLTRRWEGWGVVVWGLLPDRPNVVAEAARRGLGEIGPTGYFRRG